MKHKDLVENVVIFIMTRTLEELSQLTRYRIAEIFDINKNYLGDKFKKETEKTVFHFINFERMKRAEKLLTSRYDLSVEDISRKVGIVKCKQFRLKFKQIYGLNPGKYRQLFKDNHSRTLE